MGTKPSTGVGRWEGRAERCYLANGAVSPAAMYSHALCIITAIHPPQGDILRILKRDLQVTQMVFKDDFDSACFMG